MNFLLQVQPLMISILLPLLASVILHIVDTMPSRRKQIIESLVEHAVMAVEQLGSNEHMTPEQKRSLALEFAQAALHRFHIRLPDAEVAMFLEYAVATVLNFDRLVSPTHTSPVPVTGFVQASPQPQS